MKSVFRMIRVLTVLSIRTATLHFRLKKLSSAEQKAEGYAEIQRTAQALCDVLRMRVEMKGELPDLKQALLVSSHLGYIDMVILASAIPVSFVAKKELKARFLFGWVARTFQTIFVDRDRKTATESFVREVQGRIREGYRVLVFPEGRATLGDTVYPFKTGAFEAIANTEVPVLPVYLGVSSINGQAPVGEIRWNVCWHDPMPMFPHIRRMMALDEVVYRVEVGRPISSEGKTRRALSIEALEVILDLHTAHHQEMGVVPVWVPDPQ